MTRARERAEAEWARTQERTAARDRVQQWNDGSLEVAILMARVGSGAGLFVFAVLGPVAVIINDWRGYAAVALWAAAVLAAGWWGWWYYGNVDWRKRKDGATDAGQ